MIVVADASPIIVLMTVGHIDLLPQLFDGVLIPPEVRVELEDPKRRDDVRAFMATLSPWLEVRQASAVEEICNLNAGETAAIALARELQADLIIDEKLGRRAASARGVHVVGTVGVSEKAAKWKLIDLAEAFEKLQQTDFWLAPSLLAHRLALFNQSK